MSLKDLLTSNVYEELCKEAAHKTQRVNKATVKCPICGKETIYSQDNKYRPFCSLRCKYIDLGAWINEERSLAGKSINEDDNT